MNFIRRVLCKFSKHNLVQQTPLRVRAWIPRNALSFKSQLVMDYDVHEFLFVPFYCACGKLELEFRGRRRYYGGTYRIEACHRAPDDSVEKVMSFFEAEHIRFLDKEFQLRERWSLRHDYSAAPLSVIENYSTLVVRWPEDPSFKEMFLKIFSVNNHVKTLVESWVECPTIDFKYFGLSDTGAKT